MRSREVFDPDAKRLDILCFSHLRWNDLRRRPRHLMSRFARTHRLFFVEDPVESDVPGMTVHRCDETGVYIAVPTLPPKLRSRWWQILEGLLRDMMNRYSVTDYIAWYYTPEAIRYTAALRPRVTVYDCIEEFTVLQGDSAESRENEKQLMSRCDLIFTGGYCLFEAKCEQHGRVYAFPSSADVDHFAQARFLTDDPSDQETLAHPRIGYAGVIDRRIHSGLLEEVADKRPDWQFVMIGPVAASDAKWLPERPNIHYLGMKPYDDLPKYCAGWDVGMLPLVTTEATRFRSPTHAAEYLAAGLPVVSTPIRDIVRTYSQIGLLRIGATADEFCGAIEASLNTSMGMKWRERADHFLRTLSWDKTWSAMNRLLTRVIDDRDEKTPCYEANSTGARIGEALGV